MPSEEPTPLEGLSSPKVDLTVVTQDGSEVLVTPGSLFGDGVYNVLTFRVTNTGNTTQDYALSVVTVATGGAAKFGGTDAFDMEPEPVPVARIFVNSVMDVPGSYDNGVDVANFIDELPAESFFDVFVVLDCPVKERTGNVFHQLSGEEFVVNIDHHISNEYFGNVNWVEPSLSSVGEMLFHVVKELELDIESDAAIAIYSSIVTDTGMFNYDNTSSATHQIAAELISKGADPKTIYSKIFENKDK